LSLLSLLWVSIFSQQCYRSREPFFSHCWGVFLVARSAFGDILRKKVKIQTIQKMEKGFQENPVSYLLFLRFIPLFPFWMVNLVPAFFGVHFWTYVWTTFLGILPGSFVFTQAGAGLGEIFESEDPFSFDAIFNLKIKIALVCLGLFALIPVILKKIFKWDK
jgi:uncharacterized membrane protein YdjX (TVP38/TMEM64 family)